MEIDGRGQGGCGKRAPRCCPARSILANNTALSAGMRRRALCRFRCPPDKEFDRPAVLVADHAVVILVVRIQGKLIPDLVALDQLGFVACRCRRTS